MTAQVHEKLLYEGEESSMAFCPPLPTNDPRIKHLNDYEIEDSDSIIFYSSCLREYVGTWEIKDGKFYLVDIIGRYKNVGDSPILADWFSGIIRILRGGRLHYVHMGFKSVYEEELHVKIDKGFVVKSKTIDNRGKKVDESDLVEWTRSVEPSYPGYDPRQDIGTADREIRSLLAQRIAALIPMLTELKESMASPIELEERNEVQKGVDRLQSLQKYVLELHGETPKSYGSDVDLRAICAFDLEFFSGVKDYRRKLEKVLRQVRAGKHTRRVVLIRAYESGEVGALIGKQMPHRMFEFVSATESK